MRVVLEVIIWLLIPAGLLPVLTSAVLARYRHADSQSLRDRWHLSLALAALGAIVAILAANRLWDWGISGMAVTITFGLILLAVDVVSGKWLLDYFRGRFR